MNAIAPIAPDVKTPGRPAARVTVPVARLHELARRVEKLGLAGRFDPETAFAAREELAHDLRRLAAGGPA